MSALPLVTRFAPSPSGPLHLGHAYSALIAAREAAATGGRFLVRIEDIDSARCRPEFEAMILEDLAWLGLAFELPCRRQSDHLAEYELALARLNELGLIYPCFCTRKEIQAEVSRMRQAPHGFEGPLYPGTCRQLKTADRQARMQRGRMPAMRLNMAAAISHIGGAPGFFERGGGPEGEKGHVGGQPELLGDVVLARRDIGTSYHLAVVVDDAAQAVNLVTRGVDLFHATHVQRVLQSLLGLSEPEYMHHSLVRGENGKRLAKRDDSVSLAYLRASGMSPDEVWQYASKSMI